MATRRKPPKKSQPTKAFTPEEISPTGKILFFTTTDCKPCDVLKTWLGKHPAYAAHVEVVYIEDEATTERHEHATRIARAFKVRSFPTLLRPYDSQSLHGLGDIHEIKNFIAAHAQQEATAHIQAAREFAAKELCATAVSGLHIKRLLAIIDR